MDNPEEQGVFRPLKDDIFHFSCHQGLPCFTVCCAKLRLILTPYDILRMKNRLGITSDQFLLSYTETLIENQGRFPMVKLRMEENRNKVCPFVTAKGCEIYTDRPGACRLYPVGRASANSDGEREAREKYFLVVETHCKGFSREKAWNLDEWLNHEGMAEYNAMNDQWLEIITSSRGLGPKAHIPQKHQMFFMASYNLDKFRKFVFKSGFFDRFDVDPDLKETIHGDDLALMQFGFAWLKFSLFGEETAQIRLKIQSRKAATVSPGLF